MDNRLEQSLVTEYDGSTPTCSDSFRGKPLGDIAGLDVLCGGRYEGYLLRRHFVDILIEDGLASLFQTTEEYLFHLLQKVEADEDIGVVVESQAFVGGHLTVERSFITKLLLGQSVVEGGVDVADMTPESQEPFLEFRVMVVGKVTEEATDHIPLFVGKITHIIQLVDIPDIGEDLISRSHVLVEVVEVGQEQLSPAIEMVEALFDACTLGEALVEFADQQDRVGHFQL